MNFDCFYNKCCPLLFSFTTENSNWIKAMKNYIKNVFPVRHRFFWKVRILVEYHWLKLFLERMKNCDAFVVKTITDH